LTIELFLFLSATESIIHDYYFAISADSLIDTDCVFVTNVSNTSLRFAVLGDLAHFYLPSSNSKALHLRSL
jgi:hypothetical protein